MWYFLEEDLHAVELENATLAGLSYLVGVEKFELTDTFVVVVLDADAASPLLDLALGRPKTDINWVGSVEN
jgi:hypothetical protein